MKTALVLCGGGAKGAYEVGCIRALQQLNIKIDIVCGTSIGALNGLLVVQQDYDALEKLWQEMSIEKVMVTPVLVPSDTFINNSNMLLSFLNSLSTKRERISLH